MKNLSQITQQEIIDFLKEVDKKTWIRIGIGTGIGLLLIVFVIWPAWFKRPQVRSQMKALEGQIMVTQALFLKKPQLLKNKVEYAQFISQAKSRLYSPGESSLLLGAISKLAVESNVSVVASMPKDSGAKFPTPFDKAYEGNMYDFSLEGGYHNLGQFISKVESNGKLLRVETFSVKYRPENPTSHLSEISMSAVSLKKDKAA